MYVSKGSIWLQERWQYECEVLQAVLLQGFYLARRVHHSWSLVLQAVLLQGFYLTTPLVSMPVVSSTSCTSPRVLSDLPRPTTYSPRSTSCTSPRVLSDGRRRGCRARCSTSCTSPRVLSVLIPLTLRKHQFYKLYFSKGSIWETAAYFWDVKFYKLYFSKGSICPSLGQHRPYVVLQAVLLQGFYLGLSALTKADFVLQAVLLQGFYLPSSSGPPASVCSTSCTSPRVLSVRAMTGEP